MPSELRTLYSCEGNTRKNALAARVARGIPIKKCGIVSNNYPTKIREEPKFFMTLFDGAVEMFLPYL